MINKITIAPNGQEIINKINETIEQVNKGGGGGAVSSVNGQTGDVTITVPTNNNQLTNGAGYITSSALNGYATTGQLSSYIPNSSRNTNGGVAGINSQGHLILPNGTELW